MNKLTYTNACDNDDDDDNDNSIAMNRDKGNGNLESGDWTIEEINNTSHVYKLSLLRTTTISPFQYQVQLKLMIQISDSISNNARQ